MTETTAIVSDYYNPEASIVINEADMFSTPNPTVMTAREISGVLRQHKAMTQREATKIERIEKARVYLADNYLELDEHADELAKILGVSLENTLEVTFDVTITATITVPLGKDVDDLSEWDFDVELNCNDSDYEVESYDAEINRIS